jgi:uncharacterized repeat protein (TIGR01451 family)
MKAQKNRFTPQVVAKVLGLGVAFTGLFLLLIVLVWLSGSGQPQAAYADPIEPPDGYPKLSLSVKTVRPTLAFTEGVALTYTIEMRNTGAYTATGTTLTDVIPEGTSYNGDAWASAAPPPTYTNGILTWQGQVGFDDTVVLTFSVTASPTLVGAVVNTAVLSHPLIANPVVVEATTVLTDHPILAVDKTAMPARPGANKPLTYTLVVVNEGQPATNLPLTVTDRVPLSTTLLHVGSGGFTNPARDIVTWTRDITLDTGEEVSFTFTVEVGDVPSGTVITNDDYLVRSPETGVAVGKPLASTVVEPILHITKDLWPDPPGSNRELTYTLTVWNSGSLAEDVLITDRLPAGVEYLRGGSMSEGLVSWTLPRMETGDQAELTFTVYISDVMGITVANDDYGICCAEGVCEAGDVLTRTVEGPHLEAFARVEPVAHKPGGGTGTEVFPMLVIQNLGPGNALDTRATLYFDRISIQASELYADPPLGSAPPFADGPDCGTHCRSFLWFGDLGHGQAITFTTYAGQGTIGGDEGTPYSTTVVISDSLSNVGDVLAEDRAIGLVTKYANLVPAKSAATVVAPGELLTYTIQVVNRAMTSELPAVLTDVVPVGTSFVSASDGGISLTVSDTVIVSWTLPILSVGEGTERSFAVRVDQEAISGTQIVNWDYAVLGYGNVITGALGSGPPVTTTVREIGLVGSYKQVTPERAPLGPGNVLTYYLHVVNTGPADLEGVTVYDLLPWETTTYQRDAVASAGAIISDIVSFHWTGDVAAFSSEVLTFTVVVDPDYFGYITNTATISHPRLAAPVLAQATAFIVADRPLLRISKTANPGTVEVGDELTYTLLVANDGLRASNVVVVDKVPRYTKYVTGSASADGKLVGDQVRWVIPRLEPLEERTLQFRVMVEGGWSVVNRFYSVSSAEGSRAVGVPVRTGITGGVGWIYLPMVLKNAP